MSYSMMKHKKTEEIHIFDDNMNLVQKEMKLDQISVCKEVDKSDCSSINVNVGKAGLAYGKAKFGWQQSPIYCSGLTEEEVHFIASIRGRKVCGTCLSHLYETEED